jgi:hypothetical protein
MGLKRVTFVDDQGMELKGLNQASILPNHRRILEPAAEQEAESVARLSSASNWTEEYLERLGVNFDVRKQFDRLILKAKKNKI